jgi:hypothetical protein
MYAFQHIFLLDNLYFISLIDHISDIFSSVSSDNMEGSPLFPVLSAIDSLLAMFFL